MKIFISEAAQWSPKKREKVKNTVIHRIRSIVPSDKYELVKVKDVSFNEIKPTTNLHLYRFSKAIEELADSDLIVFSEDYSKYKTCKFEEEIAIEYGIPRYYLNDEKVSENG